MPLQPLRSYLYTFVYRRNVDGYDLSRPACAERIVAVPATDPATSADTSATGTIAETPLDHMVLAIPSPTTPTNPPATPDAAPIMPAIAGGRPMLRRSTT